MKPSLVRYTRTLSDVPLLSQQETDLPELPASYDAEPETPSVSTRLDAFRDAGGKPKNSNEWVTQLLTTLPDVKTADDIKAWFCALEPTLPEPPLYRIRPDLPVLMSKRLSSLLRGLTPEEVRQCVTICLDKAWAADPCSSKPSRAWVNLCAKFHQLSPPAMEALLIALYTQQSQVQLPSNGGEWIFEVSFVLNYLRNKIPELGFCRGGSTQVVRIQTPPVKSKENETIVIDTGTDRQGLNNDELTLVMWKMLRDEGIDWMRPEGDVATYKRGAGVLLNLALVNKYFSKLLGPKLANYGWMRKEYSLRGEFGHAEFGLDMIWSLLGLPRETVESMECTSGATNRRLGVVLRTSFWVWSRNGTLEMEIPTWDAYDTLHRAAVVQGATCDMPTRFAQHISLLTLPFQYLTMAFRMLRREQLEDLKRVGGDFLQLYPQDVQVTTLICLLSLEPETEGSNPIFSRIEALMAGSKSWPTPPHEWLYCQCGNLKHMLALIANPDQMLDHEWLVNQLLEGLERHHGLSGQINDPFGEHYVPWTVADILLLAAMCNGAEVSGGAKVFGDRTRPRLVNCLVDLLRQFASVCAPGQRLAGPEFTKNFPADVLHSAFLQLTPTEQGRILTRVYFPDGSDDMDLIETFANNAEIKPSYRLKVLESIRFLPHQHSQCQELVGELIAIISPPSHGLGPGIEVSVLALEGSRNDAGAQINSQQRYGLK